ncbi:MAG: class I SAM-dependent methyltransferase [Phycisphaerae bacterium]|nr:class I SAM-dependent methyltransferase [Phycisphaerae bacterium]
MENGEDDHRISAPGCLATYPYLHDLMRRYQLKDLVNVSAESFVKQLDEFLNIGDPAAEGADVPANPCDPSAGFYWGHHHDFGEFGVPGRMCKHHFSMLNVFIDELDVLPLCLDGLRVLDVGCWTGGTSLLLCAMGAEVVAVEEVERYAKCLDYLRYAFNIETLEVRNLSLYDCTTPDFQDAFDFVLLAGVLHHVSDPRLALRITFNCLKDGGQCLLETVSTSRHHLAEPYLSPAQRSQCAGMSRIGWNSLLFTPRNLAEMMGEVGYELAQPCRAIKYKTPQARLFTVGRRNHHVGLPRAGLSVRTIR